MRRFNFTMLALAVFAFSAGWYGCGTAPEPAASNSSGGTAGAQQDHGDHDAAEHDHAAADAGHEQGAAKTGMEKMKKGLAALSDEDRAAAEKQHVCPVSGEMLGTMGTPIKVRVKDQDVWICCPACKDELLEKPDEFLAKLKG